MKKKIMSVITALATTSLLCSALFTAPASFPENDLLKPVTMVMPLTASAASVTLSGKVHVQNVGDVTVKNFDTVWGSVGKSQRLEVLGISVKGMSGTIYLQTHIAGIGWQTAKSASTSTGKYIECGTRGQSRAIEAIRIWLGGEIAKKYDVYYNLHCMDTGWATNQGYMRNQETAGTTGQSKRAEAIIISLQPKSTVTKYAATSGSPLDIYLQKGNTSVKLSQIPHGAAVKVHQTASGWAFVDYTGDGKRYSGWVDAKYLSSTKPADIKPLDTCLPLADCYCSWSRYTPEKWSFSEHRDGGVGGRKYHLGSDMKGSSNNLMAIMDGTVAASGWNSANGNYIIIKHTSLLGQTFYSFYAHLSKIGVSAGQSVKKGQNIGVIGNTGSSSAGTHLHLAIVDTLWSNGSYWGYAEQFSGDYTDYKGVRYYSPYYVIYNDKLPS